MSRLFTILSALLLAGCSMPTPTPEADTPRAAIMPPKEVATCKDYLQVGDTQRVTILQPMPAVQVAAVAVKPHGPAQTVLWTRGNCSCDSNNTTGQITTNCYAPVTNFIIAGVTISNSQPLQCFRTSNGWLQASPNFRVWTNLAKCSGSVTLGWNASADPTVTSYNVYWGGAAPTNELCGIVGTNATVAGLQPGVAYNFWATTQNRCGMESGFAGPVSGVVPFTITKG